MTTFLTIVSQPNFTTLVLTRRILNSTCHTDTQTDMCKTNRQTCVGHNDRHV